VVAAMYGKGATRIWKDTLFNVLHMGAIDTDGHIMFRLTRNRTGMTADTFAIVYYKAIIHYSGLPHSMNLGVLINFFLIRLTVEQRMLRLHIHFYQDPLRTVHHPLDQANQHLLCEFQHIHQVVYECFVL
jgi:hypothetical protein